MKVYGIANHGPEQTFSYLFREYDICISSFIQVPLGAAMKAIHVKGRKNIMFFSVLSFKKNLKYLLTRKYRGYNVFVHGSCQQMFDVGGIIPLDFDHVSTERFYDFKLNDDFYPLQEDIPKIRKSEQNYIETLTEKVQNGSILTSLMTVIYTIPKSINQKAITYNICDWFYNNKSDDHLSKFFDSAMRKYSLSKTVRARLEEILLGDTAKKFRKAFKKIQVQKQKGKSVDENEIGQKYEVPAFELRYITVKYLNEDLIKNKDKRSVDALVEGREK